MKKHNNFVKNNIYFCIWYITIYKIILLKIVLFYQILLTQRTLIEINKNNDKINKIINIFF